MPFWIQRQTNVGAAVVLGRVIHPAVRIDFKHVRRPRAVNANITPSKAGRAQLDKKLRAFIAQTFREFQILDGERRKSLVVHPLQIRMFEALPLGKLILRGRVGLGAIGVVWILRHQNGAFNAVDVLLNQGGAVA